MQRAVHYNSFCFRRQVSPSPSAPPSVFASKEFPMVFKNLPLHVNQKFYKIPCAFWSWFHHWPKWPCAVILTKLIVIKADTFVSLLQFPSLNDFVMKKNALFGDLRPDYLVEITVNCCYTKHRWSFSIVLKSEYFLTFFFACKYLIRMKIIEAYSYNFPWRKQHHMMLPFVTPETI